MISTKSIIYNQLTVALCAYNQSMYSSIAYSNPNIYEKFIIEKWDILSYNLKCNILNLYYPTIFILHKKKLYIDYPVGLMWLVHSDKQLNDNLQHNSLIKDLHDIYKYLFCNGELKCKKFMHIIHYIIRYDMYDQFMLIMKNVNMDYNIINIIFKFANIDKYSTIIVDICSNYLLPSFLTLYGHKLDNYSPNFQPDRSALIYFANKGYMEKLKRYEIKDVNILKVLLLICSKKNKDISIMMEKYSNILPTFDIYQFELYLKHNDDLCDLFKCVKLVLYKKSYIQHYRMLIDNGFVYYIANSPQYSTIEQLLFKYYKNNNFIKTMLKHCKNN